jgi:hypothetical protein
MSWARNPRIMRDGASLSGNERSERCRSQHPCTRMASSYLPDSAGSSWISMRRPTLCLLPLILVARCLSSDGVNSERLHDRLVAEMRTVFADSDTPDYLDKKAASLLDEGRQLYRKLLLDERTLVPEERNTHVFLWRGSQATAVLSAALARAGFKCAMHDLGLSQSRVPVWPMCRQRSMVYRRSTT